MFGSAAKVGLSFGGLLSEVTKVTVPVMHDSLVWLFVVNGKLIMLNESELVLKLLCCCSP